MSRLLPLRRCLRTVQEVFDPSLLVWSPAILASSKPYLHCFYSTGPLLPLQAAGQLSLLDTNNLTAPNDIL